MLLAMFIALCALVQIVSVAALARDLSASRKRLAQRLWRDRFGR